METTAGRLNDGIEALELVMISTAFRTARGALAVAVALASLLVACGQESAGQAEIWQREGQLLAWDREVWIIDTVPIIVPATLNVDGERTLGSRIDATGTYDEQGRMVAEAVTISNGSLPDATLAEAMHEGVIASVSDTIWVVDGVAVILSDGVSITAPDGVDATALAISGNLASVIGFHFGDGTIIATEIALSEAPRQADTNADEHPAITVERQPEPADSRPESERADPASESQPATEENRPSEPDPAPPSNGGGDDDDDEDDNDRGDDDDDRDDDDDGERKGRDRDKKEKKDRKAEDKKRKKQ